MQSRLKLDPLSPIVDKLGVMTKPMRNMLLELFAPDPQFDMSGTDTLDPTNGWLQILTLTGTLTLVDALEDGDLIRLHVVDGATYTLTPPAITWIGGAPTYTAYDVLEFWKGGTTLFGRQL